MDFDQILYMHWYWQDVDLIDWTIFFFHFQQSYGPWLMSEFHLCSISCGPILEIFNSVMALDWCKNFNFISFLNIFRNNEWILIKFCFMHWYKWSMLWLIHIIFTNFSTELWPLTDFRTIVMLSILWNNCWIWSNLVDTLIFFMPKHVQQQK